MPKICLYLQLHQPYRLENVSLFDVGQEQSYFERNEAHGNEEIFQKVAKKSYVPMLSLLLELLLKNDNFTFALSTSGVFLEQALEYEPKVIDLLKKLVRTGQVELLAETYHHSLASLYSPTEFATQVTQHAQIIKKLFGVTPVVFRNTELIYSNDIAEMVRDMGFVGMLADGVERHLQGRRPTQVFTDKSASLPLLLKHADLSDDIAFRFSDSNWPEYPLSVNKYQEWMEVYDNEEIINLFMDFETFGEHQWEDTGIFTFFAEFVEKNGDHFVTPTAMFAQYSSVAQQALETNWGQKHRSLLSALKSHFVGRKSTISTLPVYDVPQPISWADVDRDLTAWRDNDLQTDTLKTIYDLEPEILATDDKNLISNWRLLQTSDHFYYMCTKWAADGDVHAYFSPFETPFEAYRQYSIALADVQGRLFGRPSHKTPREMASLHV